MRSESLHAGAAAVDITPAGSAFLWGYPHVRRYSTGVHDPLMSTALYLREGASELVFIANDIIYVGKTTTQRVRERISAVIDVPPSHIMVSATHTHSGPMTVDMLSNEADAAVPKVDVAYLQRFEDGIVEAALQARREAQPARLGFAMADGTGVGTNRRDPAGPHDPQAPVLAVQTADHGRHLAAILVYAMHPTVLHEDSTVVSGDFPAFTRKYLQEEVLGLDCPVLYHNGPCGNLSPRHVTRGNTLAEAERLGRMLGEAVRRVWPALDFRTSAALEARQVLIDLPRRTFCTAAEAEARLARAIERLAQLRAAGAAASVVRTAECDWFGAEETLALARAAADGRLEAVAAACMPAEIQAFRVGPWWFVGWPGELFVEYALALKTAAPGAFPIAFANGELQGYIVTPEAAAEGGYEASNALFSAKAGILLVDRTRGLLHG